MPSWRLGSRAANASRFFLVLVAIALLWLFLFPSQKAEHRASPPKKSDIESGTEYTPGICVIARTYTKALRLMPGFLFSLTSSNYPRLHIFVVRTDPADLDPAPFTKVIQQASAILGRPAAYMMRMGSTEVKQEMPNMPEKDYGFTATDVALEKVLYATVADFCSASWPVVIHTEPTHHSICQHADLSQKLCDYVLFTNADNLYSDSLFSMLKPHLQKRPTLIGWDFISHHDWKPGSKGIFPPAAGPNVHMTVDFQVARIDLGAAVVSAEYLRAHSDKRFVVHSLRAGKIPTKKELWLADGLFYESITTDPSVKKEDVILQHSTLLLHQ